MAIIRSTDEGGIIKKNTDGAEQGLIISKENELRQSFHNGTPSTDFITHKPPIPLSKPLFSGSEEHTPEDEQYLPHSLERLEESRSSESAEHNPAYRLDTAIESHGESIPAFAEETPNSTTPRSSYGTPYNSVETYGVPTSVSSVESALSASPYSPDGATIIPVQVGRVIGGSAGTALVIDGSSIFRHHDEVEAAHRSMLLNAEGLTASVISNSEDGLYAKIADTKPLQQDVLHSVGTAAQGTVTSAAIIGREVKQYRRRRQELKKDLASKKINTPAFDQGSKEAAQQGVKSAGRSALEGLTRSTKNAISDQIDDSDFSDDPDNFGSYAYGSAKKIKATIVHTKNGVHTLKKVSSQANKIYTVSSKTAKSVARVAKLKEAQVAQAAKNAARAAYAAAQAAIGSAKSAVGALLSAGASVVPFLLPVLAAVFLVCAISSFIPTISLKADDAELTKCYDYITEQDADLTLQVRTVPDRFPNIDRYHFYLNGGETSGDSVTIQTNIDAVIAYLDVKYESYRFEDHWLKVVSSFFNPTLGDALEGATGTSIKSEVNEILKDLYSLEYRKWKSTSHHTTTDSEGKTHTSTTTTYHLDINLTAQDVNAFFRTHYNDIFSAAEQQQYEVLTDVGVYTSRNSIGNPFGTDSWYLSKRYGYYIDSSNTPIHRNGIEISSSSGKKVLAGIVGEVETGYDDEIGSYVRIKNQKSSVTYGHLQSRYVSSGQHVRSGTEIGTVGSSGNVSSPSLYLAYSRKMKDNPDTEPTQLNALFYVNGYSSSSFGGGNSSSDIVSVALSQVGVTESPAGSNNVLYNTWYYGVPVSGSMYPWCAAFVSWCADQCGYIEMGIFPRAAHCMYFEYAPQNGYGGTWYPRGSGYVPVAGDVINYRNQGHTGLVVSSDGVTVNTVEGNTSSDGSFNANGGCVYTKSPSISSPTIDGFWHPNYPSSASKKAA